jgi:hypothetical protein
MGNKYLPDRPSKEEVVDRIISSYHRALQNAGVSEDALAKQLKAELRARKPVNFKIRGKIKGKLSRGKRVVLESVAKAGDGETVIHWTEREWHIQQQAREDAQKVLGLYPAERHEVGVESESLVEIARQVLEAKEREGDDKVD